MNYRIILNASKFMAFMSSLPVLQDDEVWYGCLFARKKYDPEAQDKQLVRIVARTAAEFEEKVCRLESPVGSLPTSQASLAFYMSVNPRSIKKANAALLVTLAKRAAEGDFTHNPVSLANSEIHRAVGTKHYVDFDFDGIQPTIYLPAKSYRRIMTRGGSHVAVMPDRLHTKPDWYKYLKSLGFDRHGDELTPVPGLTQGGFCPSVVESQ
jgi:hypothetical protein